MNKNNFCIQCVRFEMKKFMKYRAEVIFGFFSELIIPITINLLFALGMNSYSEKNTNVLSLILYMFLANMIYSISISNIENMMEMDIRGSKLAYKIISPIHPVLYYTMLDITTKFISYIFFLFPFIVVSILVLKIKMVSFVVGVISILFSMFLGYEVSFLIGSMAFWMTEIWGLSAIKILLLSVLSGTVFPLDFISEKIYDLFMYSPFPYMSYFPSAILVDGIKIDDMYKYMFIALMWVFILFVLDTYIWRKGMKKYNCVGV